MTASKVSNRCDFFQDFFQTRLWVKFLEMKKIPDQLMHWISIKIFDEKIIKKDNDYYLKFTKSETPFLDENKVKREFTFKFNPADYTKNIKNLESDYFNKRDTQKSLIEKYISTDKNLISKGKFFYYVFPWFVDELIPWFQNFPVDMLAPDLSKEYVENEKLLQNMKIIHKSYHNLNSIEWESSEDNIILIWIIMWSLCFKFIRGIEEKKFRVDQLWGVLVKNLHNNKRIKKLLPIFEDVLNNLLKYGDLQMVSQILVVMNYLKIKHNSTVDNIFFMAVRKYKKAEAMKQVKIADMISEMEKQKLSKRMFIKWEKSLNYVDYDTLQAKAKFMKRTFKSCKVSFAGHIL